MERLEKRNREEEVTTVLVLTRQEGEQQKNF
jgi:hypothetical protein